MNANIKLSGSFSLYKSLKLFLYAQTNASCSHLVLPFTEVQQNAAVSVSGRRSDSPSNICHHQRDSCRGERYLVEAGPEQPGDLLDQRVRGEEGVVLLGQLLHLLLVLVEFLQVISGHAVHPNALGLVTVSLVSQQAHLVLLPGHMLQPDRDKGYY